MLVELLRPLGTELARRWLAALLLVDVDERAALVAAVESQIVRAADQDEAQAATTARERVKDPRRARTDRELHLVSPPVRRDGYVEQNITTYTVAERPARSSRSTRSKRA